MKTKNIIFSTLILLSSILSSCSSNNLVLEQNTSKYNSLNKEKTVNDFYPINTGKTWTYSLKQYQDEQPNTKFNEMTISIVNNTKEQGFDSAVMKRFYPNSSIQPNQTLAKIFPDHIELSRYVQQSIFESLGAKVNKSIDYIDILNSPLQSGTNWQGRTFKGGTEMIEIIGQEDVTVEAGTFKAIKTRHHLIYDNGKEDNLYYWYADGIGMVKLHEEITMYIKQWVKMKSDGELKSYSK